MEKYKINFTFHNVSINTVVDGDMKIKLNTLHSTMVLLIRDGIYHKRRLWTLYIPQCFY